MIGGRKRLYERFIVTINGGKVERTCTYTHMHIREGGGTGGAMPIPTGIETGNSLVTLDKVRRLMCYMLLSVLIHFCSF